MLRAGLGGDRVLTVVADVRDLAAMQAAADQGIERFGGIDIVVANAGIAVFGSVLNVDPQAFKTLVDVNALGVFHTVRAALPSVIARRGYVLVVSSFAAYAPVAGSACYSLSKAGVEHFANALRLEVAHHGVDVGLGAHVLDRHPARAGGQGRTLLDARRHREPARSTRQDHVGPGVRSRVRERASRAASDASTARSGWVCSVGYVRC